VRLSQTMLEVHRLAVFVVQNASQQTRSMLIDGSLTVVLW
jgi:hypothetical protein